MAQRYEILDYIEVPIERVRPNPRNPRPSFHMADDDPNLLALGDDIATNGQHRPGLIFELVGHWSYPDEPGHYMLLQGESRWRAAKLAKVDTYRALLVPVPASEAEELEWLGIEEAHKRDWGTFFVLRFAAELAARLGLPKVAHADVAARTGLSMGDLRLAEKISKLEPEIQALVALYEQELYEQKARGGVVRRPRGARLQGSGVRAREFTTIKAGLVYDIFVELRSNLTKVVERWNDVDLQVKIAQWATIGAATTDDLENLLSSLRAAGRDAPPGLITQIADLLQNEDRRVKDVVRASGNSQVAKLQALVGSARKLEERSETLRNHVSQLGVDVELLERAARQFLRTSRQLDDLERAINLRIRSLPTGRRVG